MTEVAPRCTWPDCLTPEQQQCLVEDIARTDRGEDPVIEPDQRLVCGCVDLGVSDDLGDEFAAHAEESLVLANEAFESAEVLRQVLLLADRAMEAEGVPLEKRDRVVHWILVGEPAPGWDPDPDAELADAMRAKVAGRDAWVRHLEGLPFGGLSPLEPEA